MARRGRIQLLRGTIARWTAINPVLMQGEIGVELDTRQFKIGDGITAWNSLPYGAQGPMGPASIVPGPAGYTPIKGVDYFDGIQGIQGIPGYTPIKGIDYFDGIQGIQGIQGIPGDPAIIPGGILGNALFKNSATDGDVLWRGITLDDITNKFLWKQLTINTIPAATTTAVSLLNGGGGTGNGSLTLPAGFWTAGKELEIEIFGHCAYTNTSTVTISVILGGVTINVPITSASMSAAGSWRIRCRILYTGTGFIINGYYQYITTANVILSNPITRQVAGATLPTEVAVPTPTTIDIRLAKGTANRLTFVTTHSIIKVGY